MGGYVERAIEAISAATGCQDNISLMGRKRYCDILNQYLFFIFFAYRPDVSQPDRGGGSSQFAVIKIHLDCNEFVYNVYPRMHTTVAYAIIKIEGDDQAFHG
jgi:hypothetical protein